MVRASAYPTPGEREFMRLADSPDYVFVGNNGHYLPLAGYLGSNDTCRLGCGAKHQCYLGERFVWCPNNSRAFIEAAGDPRYG